MRGRGGGQKINKVKNCVQLKHVPTGSRCTAEARTLSNRSIARKLLERKVEHQLHETVRRAVPSSRSSSKQRGRRHEAAVERRSSDNESGERRKSVRIKSVGPNWSAVGERPTTR